jgi:hypothetical protein
MPDYEGYALWLSEKGIYKGTGLHPKKVRKRGKGRGQKQLPVL